MAVQQQIAIPRRAERERLPTQIMRRRWRFFVRYLLAKSNSRSIARLLPILRRSFEHPWVARIELRIRFWPGNETSLDRLWRLYKSTPKQSMHWDAPITISVYRARRGKQRQALCMSLYLVKDILYIGQIQGIAGTDAPKELRAWPKIFIEACRTFVRQENLREVRMPKAKTLYSYRNPFLNSELLPQAREASLQRIRRNMGLLYDKNALDMGFVSDGEWLKWKNTDEVWERAGNAGRTHLTSRPSAAPHPV
jgi:hypothetical protein